MIWECNKDLQVKFHFYLYHSDSRPAFIRALCITLPTLKPNKVNTIVVAEIKTKCKCRYSKSFHLIKKKK